MPVRNKPGDEEPRVMRQFDAISTRVPGRQFQPISRLPAVAGRHNHVAPANTNALGFVSEAVFP